MRIVLISLMLLVGVNQMLARTLYWFTNNYELNGNVYDDDYDPLRVKTNYLRDDLYKLVPDENSLESEEENLKTFTNSHEDEELLNDFFGSLITSILPIHEENVESDEKPVVVYVNGENNNNGNEDDDGNDDDDDDYGKMKQTHLDEASNDFVIHISHIFDTEGDKSSEEKNNVADEQTEEASKSSEETVAPKEDESGERSAEEIESGQGKEDVEKSSGENKSDADDSISEKDIRDLTYVLMTLNILDELSKVTPTDPDYASDDSKAKEVDQYLDLLIGALDRVETRNYDNDGDDNEKDEDDDRNNFTFRQNESDENDRSEDNNVTTKKYDSDEDDDDNATTATSDSDEGGVNDSNTSDSNENDSSPTYFVFHGIDDASAQHDLTENKYDIVESAAPELHTTSAPALSESVAASRSEEVKVISQYSDIRANLDAQQSTLQTNEKNLDKDFYSLISNNYDDESMKKFENDIYIVHEDLDRIKRNINNMQNFQSKLYLHKLITAAVQNAQSKLKN